MTISISRTRISQSFPTWNTPEVRFQVALEVVVARPGSVQLSVGYPDDAGLPAGAASVGVTENVDGTSDESEVHLDTRSDLHPSVRSVFHQDHLTRVRALGNEVLVVTVFLRIYG